MKLRPQLFPLLVVASSLWMIACDDGDQTGGAGGNGGEASDDGSSAPDYTGPTCETAGDSYCTGSGSGIVCAEGSTYGVEFRCTTGEECVDGACQGQCEPEATECAGTSVQRVCADDGRSWLAVACGDGRSCIDGECLLPGGLVCTPGEHKCDGLDVALTCNEDGSGWDELECPSATACEDGACRGEVCAVGASKCADALLAPLPGALFAADFEAIYRCVDGSAWVPDFCPSDEETRSICVYDGVDPSVANAYRTEVNAYFESPGAAPTPPTLPSFTTASCVDIPEYCDAYSGGSGDIYSWVYPPSATSNCSDLTDLDDVPPEYWSAFSLCSGMPPLSPVSLQVTECTGLTACMDNGPSGASCFAVECLPTEAECADATSYKYCDPNGFYWSSTVPCPDTAACANVETDAPERSVTCGGTPVVPWSPPD